MKILNVVEASISPLAERLVTILESHDVETLTIVSAYSKLVLEFGRNVSPKHDVLRIDRPAAWSKIL